MVCGGNSPYQNPYCQTFNQQGAPFSLKKCLPYNFLSHTDGHEASKQESQRLKNKGIAIFALGLGSFVNSAEINALASEPNHVFHYSSFRQMLPTDNGLRIALALCSGKQQPMYAEGNVALPFCTRPRERCFWIAIM